MHWLHFKNRWIVCETVWFAILATIAANVVLPLTSYTIPTIWLIGTFIILFGVLTGNLQPRKWSASPHADVFYMVCVALVWPVAVMGFVALFCNLTTMWFLDRREFLRLNVIVKDED